MASWTESIQQNYKIAIWEVVTCSPEMFGNVIVLELASQLIQAVLAVVSAVTPHAAVYTPLSLLLLSVV